MLQDQEAQDREITVKNKLVAWNQNKINFQLMFYYIS